MKIAIPTSDCKNISKHVAMSKYFNIYENNELISQIQNPLIENFKEESLMHSHNGRGLGAGKIIPPLLSQQNVSIFLAREIGEGMKKNLEAIGIKSIETQEKEIQKALKSIT